MSKHIGLGLVLSLFSLAVGGCSAAPGDVAGSNGAAGANGSSGASGAVGSGADGASGGAPATAITETEPNNGPDMAGMQNLGVLDAGATLDVKGRLDSGGNDGKTYTGDFDGFAFEITATGGTLSSTIDWTGSADVDVILYDVDLKAVAADATTAKPISKSGPIPPGKYAIVLFSKDQAADWTMKLSYTTASSGAGGSSSGGATGTGGSGCIDPSTLSGGYWQKMHGGLEEIRFNDGGGLDYGSANPVSGTVWYAGSWTLSCPTLQADITSSSPYTFQVNGSNLIDQNGVAWVRCTPLSNGECF